MAQLAIHMDQDGPEHPLQGEEAYFDGSHSQCVSSKMLALFVYHQAMWLILRLATMKVKNESTYKISMFRKLFKVILSEIMERDYTFNPKAFMIYKDGAKCCAIRQVCGVNFTTSEVASC